MSYDPKAELLNTYDELIAAIEDHVRELEDMCRSSARITGIPVRSAEDSIQTGVQNAIHPIR